MGRLESLGVLPPGHTDQCPPGREEQPRICKWSGDDLPRPEVSGGHLYNVLTSAPQIVCRRSSTVPDPIPPSYRCADGATGVQQISHRSPPPSFRPVVRPCQRPRAYPFRILFSRLDGSRHGSKGTVPPGSFCAQASISSVRADYERFVEAWNDADPELQGRDQRAPRRLHAFRATTAPNDADGAVIPVGLPRVPDAMGAPTPSSAAV